MSSNRNTFIRSLHDLGAAAWFGGQLMGAVGVNGASKDVKDPAERAGVASAAWARWAPVSAVAIGAHLTGSIGILVANRNRARYQAGATANSVVKAAITVAALGTTVYSGVLGARIARDSGVAGSAEGTAPLEGTTPVEGGTVPSAATPETAARLQQQQRVLQWVTPVLTGTLIVLGAQQGEQQRGSEQLRAGARGIAQRVVRQSRNAVAA